MWPIFSVMPYHERTSMAQHDSWLLHNNLLPKLLATLELIICKYALIYVSKIWHKLVKKAKFYLLGVTKQPVLTVESRMYMHPDQSMQIPFKV